MSGESTSKFGVLKGLQQNSKAVNSKAVNSQTDRVQPSTQGELPVQEVRFTNYLDADVSRRLQIHVAQLKAKKVPGGDRVSIKSVLHQALVEYLERNGG